MKTTIELIKEFLLRAKKGDTLGFIEEGKHFTIERD